MADNLTKVFKSFVEDIVKVFPEYNKRLTSYYKDVIESDEYEGEKLNDFLNNIEEIMDRIVEKDTKLFDEDPIILQNVSFKAIWNSEGITAKTRMDIWKYLQSFCIIKINMDSSKEKIEEVLKKIESNEKVRDKKTVNDMKKLKKLNESINNEELEKLFQENPEKVTESMNEMESMFENTNIGKIAKEITEELDIENMISKDGGIEQLFNGGNMMNIFQSISGKMDMGGDTGNLMEEASQICGQMQDNPIFSTLMNNMQQNMGPTNTPPPQQRQESNVQASQSKNINVGDPGHNPNKTRERLQKKLQEKNKNVIIDKKD
tara:strand:- start:438 stop:1394 length:957 start_codon:yes stop_codon:yes gene_type:complete